MDHRGKNLTNMGSLWAGLWIYKTVSKDTNPHDIVHGAIVCKKSDPIIEDLCAESSIAVFVESEESTVFQHRGWVPPAEY